MTVPSMVKKESVALINSPYLCGAFLIITNIIELCEAKE